MKKLKDFFKREKKYSIKELRQKVVELNRSGEISGSDMMTINCFLKNL